MSLLQPLLKKNQPLPRLSAATYFKFIYAEYLVSTSFYIKKSVSGLSWGLFYLLNLYKHWTFWYIIQGFIKNLVIIASCLKIESLLSGIN